MAIRMAAFRTRTQGNLYLNCIKSELINDSDLEFNRKNF